MFLACPKCRVKLSVKEPSKKIFAVKCPKCLTLFQVTLKQSEEEKPLVSRDAKSTSERKNLKSLIIIGHEDERFRTYVKDVLSYDSFSIMGAKDGIELLEMAKKLHPEIVILDVAIPKLLSFELCQKLKSEINGNKGLKIILIASIYDKTRYKRNPSSLYGADDYIEKHHIADRLLNKISDLLGIKSREYVVKTPPKLPFPEGTRTEFAEKISAKVDDSESLLKDIEYRKEKSEAVLYKPEDYAKAKRLARIIVSDILLYNEEVVVEGLKKGTIYELLADDIFEGEKLYTERVPSKIRETTNYLKEAFDYFLEMKMKELDGGR